MKTIVLDDSTRVYFEGLDPYSLLDRYEGKDMAGIGIALSPEKAENITGNNYGDSDVAAGLMILSLKGDSPIIMWLFVDPDFREMGIGDKLISTAFEMADRAGKDKLYCFLTSEYARDEICDGEEEYLAEHGFVESKNSIEGNSVNRLLESDVKAFLHPDKGTDAIEEEEIDAVVEQLFEPQRKALEKEASEDAASSKSTGVKRTIRETDTVFRIDKLIAAKSLFKTVVSDNVVNIGLLAPGQYQDAVKRCLKQHEGFYKDSSYDTDPLWYDLDVSCCAIKNGKAEGLFLIHRDDDGTLWPEYFYNLDNSSPENLLRMIKYALEQAEDKYPKDTKIVFPTGNKVVAGILSKVGLN